MEMIIIFFSPQRLLPILCSIILSLRLFFLQLSHLRNDCLMATTRITQASDKIIDHTVWEKKIDNHLIISIRIFGIYNEGQNLLILLRCSGAVNCERRFIVRSSCPNLGSEQTQSRDQVRTVKSCLGFRVWSLEVVLCNQKYQLLELERYIETLGFIDPHLIDYYY